MVRAITQVIDMRARLRQFAIDLRMQLMNVVLGIKAAGDARLIGDDEDEEAFFVEGPDGLLRSVDPAKSFSRADIAVVVIENPVAIEERRGTLLLPGYFTLRPGEGFGHADIDEIAVGRHGTEFPLGHKPRQNVLFQGTLGLQQIDEIRSPRIDAAADKAALVLTRTGGEVGDGLIGGERDHAIARCIGKVPHRQRPDRRRAGGKNAGKSQEIYIEPGIAIEQIELLVQAVTRVPQRATGSRALRFDCDLDIETETLLDRRRRGIGDDLFGFERGEQQNIPDAMAAELEQQHVEERPIADFKQRLRRSGGQRSKPAAETAAQNSRLRNHPCAAAFAVVLVTRGNRRASTRPQMMCAAVIWIC